jgi:hypothetical protein
MKANPTKSCSVFIQILASDETAITSLPRPQRDITNLPLPKTMLEI